MQKSLSQTICKRTIMFYQQFVSPYLGHNCRFAPSCSQYAFLAIKRRGAIKGGLFSFWRVIRCNPFVKGGIDSP